MPICIDARPKTIMIQPSDQDLAVEELSLDALQDHAADGMFCRDVRFMGLSSRHPQKIKSKSLKGPNCINHQYTNHFVAGEDDSWHVFIFPPQE